MLGIWGYYFLFLLTFLPFLTFCWYTRAIQVYSKYATDVDSNFSKCVTNPPLPNSTFAVVIPFPSKQARNVMALLYIWAMEEFRPILNRDEDLRQRTQLIFYPVYDDKIIINAIKKFIRDNPLVETMLDHTFSSVTFMPRNMDPKLDIYEKDYVQGQWISSGNTEMYYPLMTQIAPKLNISFVLYHEPDTFPLRAGWLEKVRSYSFHDDSDFWFLGSQQRHKEAIGGRIHGHMNGNSVVRVENECARQFLERVYQNYRFLPFDSSIMRYLVKQKNLREAQHLIRRMRYTDLIGNFANGHVTQQELLNQFPEMYLVHGKGYFEAINKILNIQDFKTGLIGIE